jgi:CheY-like chemotaxis protein
MLLDCRMPAMDGIEVAARIRLRELAPSDHPIILMLISDDLSGTMKRARDVGIQTYLIKPIRSADLFAALGRALGAAGASAQNTTFADRSLFDTSSCSVVVDETRPLKILLTDDSSDNRLLVHAYFKNKPYAVDDAENGAVAVEMFRTGIYDIVLMDIEMPIMDGYSATGTMRAIEQKTGRRRVPILALTASVLAEALKKALDAGCHAHVAKPVKKATLLAAVHKAIGDHEGYDDGFYP